ncbi:MAG: hypothetical protein OXC18_21295 [Desulfurellaceae bacterium]|nr:hypothetical protein [Desulfurellaceae bacterium]
MATRRERAQYLLRWLVKHVKQYGHAKQCSLVTYTEVAEFLGGTPYFITPDLKCLSDLLQAFQERDRRLKIPLIQSIVIRKDTRAPGYGIAKHLDPPLTEKRYLALNKKDRRARVKCDQTKALHYPHWDRVVKGVEALPDE